MTDCREIGPSDYAPEPPVTRLPRRQLVSDRMVPLRRAAILFQFSFFFRRLLINFLSILPVRWYRMEPNSPAAPTPMDEWTASFGVLVLESVQPEDGATYRCTAVNSLGQAQYDVRLEVLEPLRAQLDPPGPILRVDQGQSVTLQCSSNAQPLSASGSGLAGLALPSSQVKWYKDGQLVTGGGSLLQSRLKVASMKRTDQGVYQCFVHNERETAQASVRLVLGSAAPQLVHTFNEQTLIPGPFVALRCTATGNPPPDIFWLLDGQLLAGNRRIEMGQQQLTMETTGYLNITGVQVEDGGEYSCEAKNEAGKTVHSARLNVYGTSPWPLCQKLSPKISFLPLKDCLTSVRWPRSRRRPMRTCPSNVRWPATPSWR